MPKSPVDRLIADLDGAPPRPVYLVGGDLVAAEPQAVRLAEAVAEKVGCSVESYRRPTDLSSLFADLRTLALFASAKVVLAIDTAILADTAAAADLIDQAASGLPVDGSDVELSGAQREAASRLMQALHVFGIETGSGEASELLSGLPKWALQGGRTVRKKKARGRSPKEIEKLRAELPLLLEAGRSSGLVGAAEGDLAELGELVGGAMPEGHCLILAESAVAKDHPLAQSLKAQGVLVETAKVSAGRGGDWQGLGALIAELERETGVGIERGALQELAKRTLRGTGNFRDKSADTESTARLAGEYRKLASLARGAGGARIERWQVVEAIKDRGEEDVWQILDAIGTGRGGEATSRYLRLIEGADDPIAQRLSFFSLLATFCRQLSAIAGVARVTRSPPGVRSYNQFKDRVAPRLQSDLPDGAANPLAGLHPYRLHRAYLAASGIDRQELLRLPWRVLETELRIKGEASNADAAVIALISHVVASRL
ncbi:MAG: hypothetical protein AAF725_16395 [Acidobacteriota bacterium]